MVLLSILLKQVWNSNQHINTYWRRINPTAIIGKNFTISQFCTIGSNKGKAAVIGDNVYIAPNVCIVENVRIGNNSSVGAGSVVIHDIPQNAVAAGCPAKILKIK